MTLTLTWLKFIIVIVPILLFVNTSRCYYKKNNNSTIDGFVTGFTITTTTTSTSTSTSRIERSTVTTKRTAISRLFSLKKHERFSTSIWRRKYFGSVHLLSVTQSNNINTLSSSFTTLTSTPGCSLYDLTSTDTFVQSKSKSKSTTTEKVTETIKCDSTQSTTLLSLSLTNNVTDNLVIKPYNIVIVGAGVGGLATAALLSSQLRRTIPTKQFTITILEKNTIIGGRCGSFYVDIPYNTTTTKTTIMPTSDVLNSNNNNNNQSLRFRHERGPSLLLLPHLYQQIFQEASTTKKQSCEDYGLFMKLCNPAYKVVFDDGDWIDVGFRRCSPSSTPTTTTGTDDCNNSTNRYNVLLEAELLSRQKMDTYEVNGSTKWDNYMKACSAFLDCGLPNFIQEKLDLISFPSFIIQSIQNNFQAWPLKPHSDVVDTFFTSNKMRVLATFQDLYVGLEPYRNNNNNIGGGVWTTTAPAVFGLLSAIELHPTNTKCGVYAPMGGFQSVTNSLIRLVQEDPNVTIQCQSTVTRITNKGVYYYHDNGIINNCSNTTASTSLLAEPELTINNQHQYQERVQIGATSMVMENEDNDNSQSKSLLYHPADIIIVNADLPYATKVLMNEDDDDDTIERNSSTTREIDGVNDFLNKHLDVTNSNSTTLSVDGKEFDSTIPHTNNDSASSSVLLPLVRYDWDDTYRFSSGVIAFHWSMQRSIIELNTTHTVFMIAKSGRNESEQSWDVLRNNNNNDNDDSNQFLTSTLFDNPFNFYVHRPSVTDPTAAPPGMDTILVLVPCRTLVRNKNLSLVSRQEAINGYKQQFTQDFIDNVRSRVLDRMRVLVPEINSSLILHEVVDTPATFADSYSLGAGTPFGLSHGFGQLSLLRPTGPRKKSFLDLFGRNNNKNKNIFFTGASARPGNGVPLVLAGAKIVAGNALKEIKHQEQTNKNKHAR